MGNWIFEQAMTTTNHQLDWFSEFIHLCIGLFSQGCVCAFTPYCSPHSYNTALLPTEPRLSVFLSLALHVTSSAATAAKSLQLCPNLCDPIDSSPPGSPFLRFSRQEYWSGLPFPSPIHESEKWKWKVKVKSLSPVQPLVTPWTAAYQAPPSVGFSKQEYWSGVPLNQP